MTNEGGNTVYNCCGMSINQHSPNFDFEGFTKSQIPRTINTNGQQMRTTETKCQNRFTEQTRMYRDGASLDDIKKRQWVCDL